MDYVEAGRVTLTDILRATIKENIERAGFYSKMSNVRMITMMRCACVISNEMKMSGSRWPYW